MVRTAFVPVGLLVLLGCHHGGTFDPSPSVTGYTVTVHTAPPIFAFVGAPVPIAFNVTEHLSDSSSQPAAHVQLTIGVTTGGGTVNGAASTVVTTGSDGTATFVWLLGPMIGTQFLQGTIGGRTASVNLTAFPLPISTVQIYLPDTVVQLYNDAGAGAVFKDSLGREVGHLVPDVRGATFTSSNPLVATIDTPYGQGGSTTITTVGVGTTVITATAEGKSGSGVLRVVPTTPPVASMFIGVASGATLHLLTVPEAQAYYTLFDGVGNIITRRHGGASDWQSSNPSVATVSSTGYVIARSVGTTFISAVVEGFRGSSGLSVAQ